MTQPFSSSDLEAEALAAAVPLSLVLSPAGHLYLHSDLESSEFLSKTIAEKIITAPA